MSVGTNRKPVCDFLLVINTYILSRTVSKLSKIIVEILNNAFLSPLWGTQGQCTLFICMRLIGKLVVVEDFLFILIELFPL